MLAERAGCIHTGLSSLTIADQNFFVFRPVDRGAVDVGVDLYPACAEVLDRALGFPHRLGGRRKRHLGNEPRELIRMLADDIGKAVIDQA